MTNSKAIAYWSIVSWGWGLHNPEFTLVRACVRPSVRPCVRACSSCSTIYTGPYVSASSSPRDPRDFDISREHSAWVNIWSHEISISRVNWTPGPGKHKSDHHFHWAAREQTLREEFHHSSAFNMCKYLICGLSLLSGIWINLITLLCLPYCSDIMI